MNRLPSIRRWGVAALTGVTLFGGLSIVGAGVASAATAPTVTAALTTSSVQIAGTGTSAATGQLTLTVNGTTTAGDEIVITLACPTTGTAAFAVVDQTSTSGAFGANGSAGAVVNNSSGCSTVTFHAAAAVLDPTITLSGITYTTSGVSAQTLNLSGTYDSLGVAATNFTVPSTASVLWFSATSNAPAVTIPATGTTTVSPITIQDPVGLAANQVGGSGPATATATNHTSTNGTVITEPNTPAGTLADPQTTAADTANSAFTVTAGTAAVTAIAVSGVPAGMALVPGSQSIAIAGSETFNLTGTPTTAGSYSLVVTVTDGSASSATATVPLVVNAVGSLPSDIVLTLPTGIFWSGTPTVSTDGFTITPLTAQPGNSSVLTLVVTAEAPTQEQSLTISGASVITSSAAPQTVNVGVTYNGGTVMFKTLSVGTILGSLTTIYGADGTADGTVAAEFENAYPTNASAGTGGNLNVVLATDAPSANGSDALAASYLEGTLHTGLLITPATSLGTDAIQAMQLEGVTTVYVVGGPLAIDATVLAQIKALPAYKPGGLVQTGSNVTVVGPIYGADGTAAGTAAAIATDFGTSYQSAAFAGAYSSTGGNYNDTTGAATAAGPTTAVPTAIVVAGTDWQDAMSVAPEAFNQRFPVILNGPSTDTSLDADASAALTSLGVKQVIVIGGQLALQNSVEAQIAALNGGISVLRIAGIDATDTAAQLANFALAASGTGLGWDTTDNAHAVLASHVNYWTDALGSAALGGGANASFGTEPLILVENPTTIGSYTTKEMPILGALSPAITNLTVLGGPLAMPSSTVQTLLAGL